MQYILARGEGDRYTATEIERAGESEREKETDRQRDRDSERDRGLHLTKHICTALNAIVGNLKNRERQTDSTPED